MSKKFNLGNIKIRKISETDLKIIREFQEYINSLIEEEAMIFLKLSVFSENKIAQNLYKKFGFKKVAKIPKQFQYKGRLVDEIIMIKEL